MRYLFVLTALIMGLFITGSVQAGTDLDTLLQEIRQRAAVEEALNREREQEFRSDLEGARERVRQMREALSSEQARQEHLLDVYEQNESLLSGLEKDLREEQGGLGEMFGVVRQNAGDFHALFMSSLTMADRPGDLDFLNELADSRSLPAISDLERFWVLILEEMVETGRVTRISAEVVRPDGNKVEKQIVRVGSFNAVSEGHYLSHVQGRNQFLKLPRQPGSAYLRQAAALDEAAPGDILPFALDPSRGAILAQLVQSPSVIERVMQGRVIGLIIICLGALGAILFAVRFAVLLLTERRVGRQLGSEEIIRNNPLGRLMDQYLRNKKVDPETLEIRLEETIMKESPSLEKGLTTIKILAAVAPLLGLLGTVVGMIETFQSITLFGTGDPQLMAGGISQALVTTALGLTVAIPLLFLHSIASSKSRRLIGIMEEQGAGYLAEHMQKYRERAEHG
ncbi:MotA/TolQ/ExbB proton channel family protein [Desulfonatronovibrio magnus]|uniref:MotA/TolQ/ExbB proton channel family protein n=1 Tax=Desulfonatronovibrio magnus TaxID=698827 RepID=UPI0005EBD1EF|nr:MotA/TolQ/ExbB proton channel family protein [Desulfonatronovibrio magnus]